MKHIKTLEDLEKFPKLEVIVNHGIRDYETEEGEGFVETLEELGIERLGYEAIKDMNKEAERMKEEHE